MSKILDKLFNKVDKTEASYEQAMERKQEELIQLQADLQEKEAILRDMHKETLLGSISESTYEAEKEKVEQLRHKVQEVQNELQLVETYKTEDLTSVLAEIEAEKAKYTKEQREAIAKLQADLQEAKVEYLQKLVKAREEYNSIVKPSRLLEQLKIKLGKQQNQYTVDAYEGLGFVSNPSGGIDTLFVEKESVHEALSYGRIKK